MRRFTINKVSYREHSVLMASYLDEWGEDDVVLAAIAASNYSEVDPMDWWYAMCLSADTGCTLMDIGSYSGLYALMATSTRPDTKVVAFEASAMTYGRLSYNILLNQAEMRITPAHYAIHSQDGSLELAHGFGVFTMASGESIAATYRTDHKEIVPAATLDRLLCTKGEPPSGALSSSAMGLDFSKVVHAMKVDTEGAEEHVLLGATDILSRFSPHMIIEIFESDVLARIKTVLSRYDYDVVAECEGSNYVFSHREKVGSLSAQYEHLRLQGRGNYQLRRLFELDISALQ